MKSELIKLQFPEERFQRLLQVKESEDARFNRGLLTKGSEKFWPGLWNSLKTHSLQWGLGVGSLVSIGAATAGLLSGNYKLFVGGGLSAMVFLPTFYASVV